MGGYTYSYIIIITESDVLGEYLGLFPAAKSTDSSAYIYPARMRKG